MARFKLENFCDIDCVMDLKSQEEFDFFVSVIKKEREKVGASSDFLDNMSWEPHKEQMSLNFNVGTYGPSDYYDSYVFEHYSLKDFNWEPIDPTTEVTNKLMVGYVPTYKEFGEFHNLYIAQNKDRSVFAFTEEPYILGNKWESRGFENYKLDITGHIQLWRDNWKKSLYTPLSLRKVYSSFTSWNDNWKGFILEQKGKKYKIVGKNRDASMVLLLDPKTSICFFETFGSLLNYSYNENPFGEEVEGELNEYNQ